MIDKTTRSRIKSFFPSGDVSDAKEDLLVYGFDATGGEFLPEMVLFPTSAQQISDLLVLANEQKIPVTARGAGSGFVGASIPVQGGLVLVMTRFNKILDIDTDNLTATVEPGVVTGNLQREVERQGLFYPPDPASLKMSTIGGNVAMGAGGPRAVKYGVTRDYVLGLEVVLPTGEIIRTGAQTMKSVVGYDLTRLMVGSEGTLGIVTQVTLKLLPKPGSVRTMLVTFRSVDEAAKTVSALIRAKVIPRTLEFIDRSALDAVSRHAGIDMPKGAEAILLIETDGEPAQVLAEMERVRGICGEFCAIDIRLAGNEAEREQLWVVRRSISPSLLKIRPTKINEDITVPRSKIPELMRELKTLAEETGLPIISFGHAGDGNIHVNIMTDKRDKEEYARALTAVDEVFAITLRLGGTLSGEHGIGLSKAKYIESEIGAIGVTLIRKIKAVFDPNDILNPGKIVMPITTESVSSKQQ